MRICIIFQKWWPGQLKTKPFTTEAMQNRKTVNYLAQQYVIQVKKTFTKPAVLLQKHLIWGRMRCPHTDGVNTLKRFEMNNSPAVTHLSQVHAHKTGERTIGQWYFCGQWQWELHNVISTIKSYLCPLWWWAWEEHRWFYRRSKEHLKHSQGGPRNKEIHIMRQK